MALRFLLMIYLCVYAKVLAYPSNISTNQISIDSDVVADLSSTELNSMDHSDEVEAVTTYEDTEATSPNPEDTPIIEFIDQDKHVGEVNNEKNNSTTKSKPDNDEKVEYEFRVIYLPVNSPELNRPSCGCSSLKLNPGSINTGLPHISSEFATDVSSGMPMFPPMIPSMFPPMLSAPPPPPSVYMNPPPSPPMFIPSSSPSRQPMIIRMPPQQMSITLPMPVMPQMMDQSFLPSQPAQISVVQEEPASDDDVSESTVNPPK